MLTRFPPELQQ